MNINTGEIKLHSELAKEMIKSGEWLKIPEKFGEEAEELMTNNETVDFYGDTPLSKWANHHKKNNTKSRRKMAKRSKKINRRNA